MDSIRMVQRDEEILTTFELLTRLHPHLESMSGPEYLEQIRIQERELGYRMSGMFEADKLVCVAGFRICRSLGWGKFLYVDDLITDPQQQSQGSGKLMLTWLIDQARAERCGELRLDCRIDRSGAHRFYFREGFEIRCFHFRKVL